MALIAIAAVQAAFDVGLMIYRLLNRPKTPLPPLRDLQIMTSTNGSPIPFGYGTCRVAGNVIWSPGITYTTLGKKSNNGVALGPKGSFVFRASVAVAFGEGPGVISRIWADSKLVYDANPAQSSAVPVTDWPAWSATELYNPGNQVSLGSQVWQALKTNTNSAPASGNTNWLLVSTYPPYDPTQEYLQGDVVTYGGLIWVAQIASNNGTTGAHYPGSGDSENVGSENVLYWIELKALYPPPTIYPGDENQLPDSLIQASETVALTPAFRGLIYAVWENFPLTNFADRIPSFRAEVTYTRTDNLLSNADQSTTGQPVQQVQSTTSPVTLPQNTVLNNTIVVMAGGSGDVGGSGAAVTDSQGNVYTLAFRQGPAGLEHAWAEIWYTVASASAPDTVAVAGALEYRIVELPGTWILDTAPGGWAADTAGTGAETINVRAFHDNCMAFAVSCYEYVHDDLTLYGISHAGSVGAGAASKISPSDFPDSEGFGDVDVFPDAVVVFSNNQLGAAGIYPAFMDWFPGINTAVPPLSGEGISGAIALFRQPVPVPAQVPFGTKPDVLHDICHRAGLVDSQIDDTLVIAPNIITPMSPVQAVPGYLIEHPTPAKTILEVLMKAYFFDACETNGTMKFVPRGMAAALTIPEDDLGLLSDMAKIEEQIAQEQDLPKEFTVTHNDPTMDYQQNKQHKGRNTRIVTTKQQTIMEVPMTMTSDWARQTAVKALYLSWLERSSYKVNLWRAKYLLLDPTDVIGFIYETLSFQIRIAENSIGQGRAVALQGISEFAQMFNSAAVGGVGLGFPTNGLQILAPTILLLFDIPLLRDVDSNPQNTGFYYGLSSPSLTWGGGVLFDSTDNTNFVQESTSSQAVTFGYTTNVLAAPARSPWIWDNTNSVTIHLVRGSFAGDTMLNVLNGSNAVLVGSELIQYTTAVQNADGSWTLSGLLRGRRGTEWATGSHAAGELVAVPVSGVQRIQDPLSVINQLHYKKGVTAGADPSLVAAQNFTIVGNDLKPYAPVHIAGTRDISNNLTATWVRRTRVGWNSLSQDPVPLSEDSEAYSIDVMSGITVKRTLTSSTPTVAYTAAQQTTDFGSPQSSITLHVYQLSAQIGRGFVGAATV
jgi:Putative phage tail protein